MTTTPSLIERLRSRTEFWSTDGGVRWYASSNPDTDCAEAAAEIERLTAERDTLKAELAALKASQEPMFWVRLRSDGMYEGPIHNKQIERVRQQSGAWSPLYLAAPVPAAPLTLTDEQKPVAAEQLDAAARKLAACFDYPWEHMPEQGKAEMRRHVLAVLTAIDGVKP